MFKKGKKDDVTKTSNSDLKTQIISEIVDIARERTTLKSQLDGLLKVEWPEIQNEFNNLKEEIEMLKNAIIVNERKMEEAIIALDKEFEMVESGMYQ